MLTRIPGKDRLKLCAPNQWRGALYDCILQTCTRVSKASDSLTLEEFISQDLVHICIATLIKDVREECVTQTSQEAEAIGSPL